VELTPKNETDRRIASLQRALGEQEVEAALLIQNVDLLYFSGTAQAGFLFVPAAGRPFLAIRKSYERAKEESPLEDVVPFERTEEVVTLAAERGYPELGSLGLELDVLPASLYLRYQRLFPRARLVDISGIIRGLRMVKSPHEISQIAEASRRNTLFLRSVKDYLREGISELYLAGQLEAVARRNGHQGLVRMRRFNQEIFYGHLMSGENLAVPSFLESPTGGIGLGPAFPQGPGFKTIARNEPVLVDYVGVYSGYMSDETRIFCLGELPEHLKRAHEVARVIQAHLQHLGKPGTPCEELYRKAVEIAGEAGLRENFMGYASFVGHGVGLELDELPVIAPGSSTPLQEGMVIALEPKFIFPEGAVGVENTFVVTPEGLKRFSTFPDDIVTL